MNTGFFTTPRVALGVGAIEQLSALGLRRAFLVADPNPALAVPLQRLREELGKSEASIETFDRIPIPPSVPAVLEGAERARAFGPDGILALGGGSALAFARALWVAYERPEVPIDSIGPLTELRLGRKARLIAIPSTSGSGADGGWTIDLLLREDGSAFEVSSRDLSAAWTLLDPSLPRSLSPPLAVDGGVQVLANALETIASEWTNPFSDALARGAMATAMAGLPRLLRRPEDELRESMHYAATLAGMAVANAQPGLAHALARSLAIGSGRSYARLMGVLLPFVAEFNFPSARERYQTLGPVLGTAAVAHRGSLGEKLRATLASAGLPPSLRELGLEFTTSQKEQWVHEVQRTPSAIANPRLASPEELGRLLQSAYDGTPVTY